MLSRIASYYTDPRPAMASSAHPARPTASSDSVALSLTNNRTADRRVFELRPGQKVTIGRSSRSELKKLQVAVDNALFDCPVVSRIHAELRASSNPPGKQVTITDCSSLHGTTVNGLRLIPGFNLVLQSGDVIKLGERVSRGEDTHDGLSLIFHRLDEPSPIRSESPATPRGRTFHVPILSDASELDDDSESGYDKHHSAAKNTPEQPKMKPGSQDLPIVLDADVRVNNSIIDLVDEEEDDGVLIRQAAPAPTHPVESRIIPDTYEEDEAPELVSDSVSDKEHSLFVDDALGAVIHSASDDDAEGVRLPQAGLSQILNERDEISNADDDDRAMESDVDDEVEYDGGESFEEPDSLYESGASDVSGEDSPDASLHEEPSSWSTNRASSEELGELEEPQKAVRVVTATRLGGLMTASNIAPKPRYDPVRNSQPPAGDELRSLTPAPAATKPSTYTYGSFGGANPLVNPATDMSSSSRWDVPPPVSAFPYDRFYIDQYGPKPTNPFFPVSYAFEPFDPPPPLAHPEQVAAGSSVNATTNMDAAPGRPLPQQQHHSLFDAPAQHFPEVTVSAPPGHTLTTKGKISITDIVDEPDEIMERARTIVPETTNATQKRKVDQVDVEATDEAGPRKRHRSNKHATLRRLAVETAKVAGGAVVGMGATVIFLTSDYAEQLLQWLS